MYADVKEGSHSIGASTQPFQAIAGGFYQSKTWIGFFEPKDQLGVDTGWIEWILCPDGCPCKACETYGGLAHFWNKCSTNRMKRLWRSGSKIHIINILREEFILNGPCLATLRIWFIFAKGWAKKAFEPFLPSVCTRTKLTRPQRY